MSTIKIPPMDFASRERFTLLCWANVGFAATLAATANDGSDPWVALAMAGVALVLKWLVDNAPTEDEAR